MRTLVFTVLIALTPAMIRAQEACDAILAMAQVQQALERVSAPGHRRVRADMALIHRTLLRIDASNVNYALRDHPLSSQSAAISTFLVLARQVSDNYAAGRENSALNFLLTEGPSQLNRSTGMMLRGYPCLQSAEGQSRGVQQLDLGDNLEQIAVGGFTRTRVITSLVISIAMIPMFIMLILYQARRMRLRSRMEKRYYLEMPAKLVPSQLESDLSKTDMWVPITIEDISCQGAKFSPGSAINAEEDSLVTLLIEANQHAATVKWSNPHYAGVQFASPLTLAQVKQLIKLHPPTGDVRQPAKTGPPKPVRT